MSGEGTSRRRTRLKRIGVVGTVMFGLLLSACGTRESDEAIVQALRAGPATPGGAPVPPGDAAASADAPTHVTADAENAVTTDTSADAVPASTARASSHAAGHATRPPKSLTPVAPSPATSAQPPAVTSGQVAGPATLSEVTIGTIGPFSGVLGVICAPGPKTLLAWATWANAHGGLNGHRIRVVVGDNQGDPATALTLAKRMVEADKVIAMVGDINVFEFPQLQQYLQGKHVPMIGGDALHPGWFTSPNTFPVSTSVENQVVMGLKMFIDQGARKLAVAYCLEVSSLCTYINKQVLASEVGQYIVGTYQVSLVAPSYTSQCLAMKQKGVEVLYMLSDTSAAGRLMRDCAVQGFAPKLMILGLDATSDLPDLPALRNALIPGATFPTAAQGVPAIDLYNSVRVKYAGSMRPNGISSMVWTSAELLRLAAKNLSAEPTSQQIYEGLWTLKNETLGGLSVPLTFAKGRPPQAGKCFFLYGVQPGGYTAPKGPRPIC